MKKISFLLFSILFSIASFSQELNNKALNIVVSGTIFNANTKQPIKNATVIIQQINKKQLLKTTSNTTGFFKIEIPKGTYTFIVESLSFKTKTISNISISEAINLGDIELIPDTESSNTSEENLGTKTSVEIRLDKKIYNIGDDMIANGGTASDVLNNIPSVTVDSEGTISLRGDENVLILINGKPANLAGLSEDSSLRQLPADALDKVEVITSPSARYEAEGSAGVLNLILKKGKLDGLNGSVTATAGYPSNFGVSTNLNYRTKNFNYFTNTSYSYKNELGNSKNDIIYLNEFSEISSTRNEKTTYNRKDNTFNTQLGSEYYISDKSSITATFTFKGIRGNDLIENENNNYNIQETLTGTEERTTKLTEKDHNYQYALNYSKEFKNEGHSLILDFEYNDNSESDLEFITDFDTFPDYVENNPEKTSNLEKSNTTLFKGDYVHPLSEISSFELGFKTDLNSQVSEYIVEDYNPATGDFENNPNFSNNLNFDQNIYAFYAQYGSKIKNLTYLLGLRSETTNRTIILENNNENSNTKWTSLFPTVNLGLEFNEDESLTIGYNRRVRRPINRYLNPFESRTSETFIRKGNINLEPTYTNSYDFGYIKQWEIISLNSSIYYKHAINNMVIAQTEEIRDVNGEPTVVIVRMPINLDSQNRIGLDFTLNYDPFKWWNITQSFNFFKVKNKGSYRDINYNSDNFIWFTNLNSTVTLFNKIDWQTRLIYVSPSETAQTKRKSVTIINLAFGKDVLNDKATLTFNINDLLNTRKRRLQTTSETTISNDEFQFRERQFLLNFTYRLNQNKKKESNKKGNSGEMF